MKDRPTYWEYAFHRRGNVIKTIDGRYKMLAGSDDYPDRRFDPSRWALGMLFALGFFAPQFIIPLKLRPNYIFDFMMLWEALLWLVHFIQYRRTRFEPVDTDTASLFKVPEWFIRPSAAARRAKSIVISSLLLLLWLFVALNSVGFSYIRYLVSGAPRVTSVVLLTGENTGPVDPDSPSLIYRAEQGYSLFMDITVAQTMHNAAFALEDDAVHLFRTDNPVFFFWEPAFPTRYSIAINNDQIRDGSTLTLTCGDLTREWVFQTE